MMAPGPRSLVALVDVGTSGGASAKFRVIDPSSGAEVRFGRDSEGFRALSASLADATPDEFHRLLARRMEDAMKPLGWSAQDVGVVIVGFPARIVAGVAPWVDNLRYPHAGQRVNWRDVDLRRSWREALGNPDLRVVAMNDLVMAAAGLLRQRPDVVPEGKTAELWLVGGGFGKVRILHVAKGRPVPPGFLIFASEGGHVGLHGGEKGIVELEKMVSTQAFEAVRAPWRDALDDKATSDRALHALAQALASAAAELHQVVILSGGVLAELDARLRQQGTTLDAEMRRISQTLPCGRLAAGVAIQHARTVDNTDGGLALQDLREVSDAVYFLPAAPGA